MARKIQFLRTLLFSLGIGAALAFGTRTALAAAPSARSCPEWAISACTNQAGCELKCDLANQGTWALCENGCCFCLE
ncbi:MAG TPA: hypothetical protein VHG08_19450 [Longimicrobium sp.]|nr:hypothetical protein [Longimicrobium sp.]